MSNVISQFNDEQLEAINARDCSLLVSAPAGSGKTRILVSRILALLEEGYSIDEFLVLTFTNAAALEMKQRLEESLNKRLLDSLSNQMMQHLSLQKEKIAHAYITNFHGFCSTLLKQYGYFINIRPDFTIISETSLIKHRVLDRCIVDWLRDSSFQDFLKLYFPEYHFNNFKSVLLKLAEFQATIYDFDEYMNQIETTIYSPIINKQDIDQTLLSDVIKQFLKQAIITGRNKAVELKNYCFDHGLTFFYQNPNTKRSMGLPTPYENYLYFFHTMLNDLDNSTLQSFLQKDWKLPKTYAASFDEGTKCFKSEFNKRRGYILKPFQTIINDCIYEDKDEFSSILDKSWSMISTMLSYLKQYQVAYQDYKRQHNYLDFNDLEQNALLLLDSSYPVASELYHSLKEIMIDEYQDTNQIQESLIQKIAAYHKPNIPCFMVGDMKQSIYRFRQADPKIFKDKYLSYSSNKDAINRRVDLKYNYRSCKTILDSVNYIFNQIMDQEIGGLDYYLDDSAKLNYDFLRKEASDPNGNIDAIIDDAKTRIKQEDHLATEIILTSKNECKDREPAEYEAYNVARRIQELVGIIPKEKVHYQYKDIVVLMRNTKEFVTFKKVFDYCNIPSHIVLSQGFLSTVEIINSIAVLQALDNCHNDIAMTSMLLGNYTKSNFSESDLLDIKQDPQRSIYENMCLSENPRIQEFIIYFQGLKSYALSHSVKEVMEKFYLDNDYYAFVSALINGRQRKANLLLFLEMLEEDKELSLYEITQKYTDMMENHVNLSPAQVMSNDDNVVSFMTIHKSKGLEFPVVFVSCLQQPFNKQDSRARILLDKQLGMAVKPRMKQDLGEFHNIITEYDNKYRHIIGTYQNQETINEEMRIFYVALTRASKKLILTGVIDSIDTFDTWQQAIINNEDDETINPRCNDNILLYPSLRNCDCYLDWLGLSIMRHPDVIKQCIEKKLVTSNDDTLQKRLHLQANKILTYPNENNHFDNTKHAKFKLRYLSVNEIEQLILRHAESKSKIDTDYLHKYHDSKLEIDSVDKTIAVTKKIDDGDRIFVRYDPNGSNEIATNRGTIIHKVMEHLPLQYDLDLSSWIQKLQDSSLFDKEAMTIIKNYQHHMEDFIHSDVYQWMLTSKKVYREKRFSFLDDDNQIIHGIFDAIIVSDDKIVIVDYKTDQLSKYTKKAVLESLHRPQMEYYKTLLRQIFPDTKIEAVVYYLYLHKYVTI